MRKIKAYVRPGKIDEVINALEIASSKGMTGFAKGGNKMLNEVKSRFAGKTKILIIYTLFGLPLTAQSISLSDNPEKVIEVNFTQRNALVADNLSCSVDEIEILNNPPYLIFKKNSKGEFCFKECDEKTNL